MAHFFTDRVKIYHGDCREILATLPAESVHTIITSPPYYGLRDYQVDGQLGLENTPDEYVHSMVQVFRQVRRVLRTDGTCWIIMGDSYASQVEANPARTPPIGLKPKDLCGIPWRLALALQADGWWLRQDIIWHKPNAMPESVTDRCTKAHEYIFLMTKAEKYYYDADAIREIARDYGVRDRQNDDLSTGGVPGRKRQSIGPDVNFSESGRNKRSVWTVNTKPFKDAHFATFPPKLIEPCILAGTSEEGACPDCGSPWERVVEKTTAPHPNRWSKKNDAQKFSVSEGDYKDGGTLGVAHHSTTTGWQPTCKCKAGKPVPCTVLDPFHGSGTTGQVALGNGCNYIGIELNEDYIKLSLRRFEQERLF
jgi:DNA modification methylase